MQTAFRRSSSAASADAGSVLPITGRLAPRGIRPSAMLPAGITAL